MYIPVPKRGTLLYTIYKRGRKESARANAKDAPADPCGVTIFKGLVTFTGQNDMQRFLNEINKNCNKTKIKGYLKNGGNEGAEINMKMERQLRPPEKHNFAAAPVPDPPTPVGVSAGARGMYVCVFGIA